MSDLDRWAREKRYASVFNRTLKVQLNEREAWIFAAGRAMARGQLGLAEHYLEKGSRRKPNRFLSEKDFLETWRPERHTVPGRTIRELCPMAAWEEYDLLAKLLGLDPNDDSPGK